MDRCDRALAVAVVVMALAAPAAAQSPRTDTYKPSYVPPAELMRMMGARESDGRWRLAWPSGGGERAVELRSNDAANVVFVTGAPDDVASATALAQSLDLAPRQISLEARIVEVDTDRAKDLGFDWTQVDVGAGFNQAILRRTDDAFHRTKQDGFPAASDRAYLRETQGNAAENTSLSLRSALHLMQDEGAATFRDAPRVLTLNNRAATIFDGSHVTYVNRAASFANIYQTEAMDAGLRLEVLPSLVESGYLRLQLHAELTELASAFASISGSPIKSGQVVDDVIMAKDGETVLLGGFSRTVDSHTTRRFPVLGRMLPFLFSRNRAEQHHHETLIAITPHVVDLNARMDDSSRQQIEGK
jgi:type IV pilus assembly protein PilQ